MSKNYNISSVVDRAMPTELIDLIYKLYRNVGVDNVGLVHDKPLNRNQLAVLHMVAREENISPSTIVKSTGITFSGITRIVDFLEENGYLCRNRHSVDRRKLCLEIRPKGLQIINASKRLMNSLPNSLLGSLSIDERDKLLSFLQTFPEK